MKFDLDILSSKAVSDYTVLPSDDNSNKLYILSNNQTLASEIYNEVVTSHDLNKHFSTEDFNEIIDNLSADCRAGFKKSDFLMVAYNAAGCFVAQTGNTRAIQVRPDEQEIVFDTRNLVLDIYNSKAKVCQLTDYKPGDIMLLSSKEELDASSIRRTLSNPAISFTEKNDKIRSSKDLSNACYVLLNATNVQTSFSFDFLKKVKIKYIGYVALVCIICAIVAWLVIYNPFKSSDGGTVVDEDSIVNVNPPHNADTTIVKPEATPAVAVTDSIKAAEAKAAKKAKAEKVPPTVQNSTAQEQGNGAAAESAPVNQEKTPSATNTEQKPAATPEATSTTSGE